MGYTKAARALDEFISLTVAGSHGASRSFPFTSTCAGGSELESDVDDESAWHRNARAAFATATARNNDDGNINDFFSATPHSRRYERRERRRGPYLRQRCASGRFRQASTESHAPTPLPSYTPLTSPASFTRRPRLRGPCFKLSLGSRRIIKGSTTRSSVRFKKMTSRATFCSGLPVKCELCGLWE